MNPWLAAMIALVAAAISTFLVLWLRGTETHRPMSPLVVGHSRVVHQDLPAASLHGHPALTNGPVNGTRAPMPPCRDVVAHDGSETVQWATLTEVPAPATPVSTPLSTLPQGPVLRRNGGSMTDTPCCPLIAAAVGPSEACPAELARSAIRDVGTAPCVPIAASGVS